MEEGLPASIVNPSLTLAPGDWEKSSAKIFKYIWNENKFFAEGQCNYVDVRDVATVVFKLLDGDHAGQRFIASGGVIQYKDLFDQIANRFKKKGPSIKVNSSLITAFAVLEELRGRLVKSQPLVTRESVKSTRENFAFSNEKSVRELAIDYHRLAETLDFCCDYYLRTYSTNK
jgi:nucleoside-diphosphate-sugar epimerase